MTLSHILTPAAAAEPAHVIRSDEEALAVARTVAAVLAPGASQRDQDRGVPVAELQQIAASGLLGLSVPRRFGGAEVSYETLIEVFRILAAADPAVAQVPQNHYVFVDVIRLDGTEAQKAFFFAEVLRGARFGNALSERGSKTVMALETRLTRDGTGGWRLNGTKYYCTGALTAQYIPVLALDDDDALVAVYVDRHAPGVTVTSDWTAMGQRATVSGTTRLDNVAVSLDRIVPHGEHFKKPQIFGAFGQLIHAAVDVGIARNALEDGARFVATQSRPWFESPFERAADEPAVVQRFGQLAVRLYAAEELLRKAGRVLDWAKLEIDAARAAEASIAVAAAKAFGGDTAVEIANEIFALAGTRAADDGQNLHRHWRNARTHTLHDPNRWKYQHIGNFVLNGTAPPNHGLI